MVFYVQFIWLVYLKSKSLTFHLTALQTSIWLPVQLFNWLTNYDCLTINYLNVYYLTNNCLTGFNDSQLFWQSWLSVPDWLFD